MGTSYFAHITKKQKNRIDVPAMSWRIPVTASSCARARPA